MSSNVTLSPLLNVEATPAAVKLDVVWLSQAPLLWLPFQTRLAGPPVTKSIWLPTIAKLSPRAAAVGETMLAVPPVSGRRK